MHEDLGRCPEDHRILLDCTKTCTVVGDLSRLVRLQVAVTSPSCSDGLTSHSQCCFKSAVFLSSVIVTDSRTKAAYLFVTRVTGEKGASSFDLAGSLLSAQAIFALQGIQIP